MFADDTVPPGHVPFSYLPAIQPDLQRRSWSRCPKVIWVNPQRTQPASDRAAKCSYSEIWVNLQPSVRNGLDPQSMQANLQIMYSRVVAKGYRSFGDHQGVISVRTSLIIPRLYYLKLSNTAGYR